MKQLPLLLSIIGGMVDLIGYLTLGNLFTAHVTGNIAMMGAALVREEPLRLAQLLVIPMFALAVGGAWLIHRVSTARGVPSLRALLWVQFLLLASVLCFSVITTPSADPHGPAACVAALIAVSAMGCQIGLLRLTLPETPSTAMMTGNVANSVLQLLNADRRALLSLRALLGFFVGCVIAAIAVRLLKDWAWALPAGVAALALDAKEERPGQRS